MCYKSYNGELDLTVFINNIYTPCTSHVYRLIYCELLLTRKVKRENLSLPDKLWLLIFVSTHFTYIVNWVFNICLRLCFGFFLHPKLFSSHLRMKTKTPSKEDDGELEYSITNRGKNWEQTSSDYTKLNNKSTVSFTFSVFY